MRAMNGYAWRPYHGTAHGTRVEGDATVWATRWWNAWFLRRFHWKKIAILRPQIAHGTHYRIGFRTTDGQAFVMDRMVTDAQFAVRIGHEDCTFFALSKTDGHEVPLRVVATTHREDTHHQDVPLY